MFATTDPIFSTLTWKWLSENSNISQSVIVTLKLPASLVKVCCDWKEIALTMHERVFEQHEEQLIDIHDVKVTFHMYT